LLYNRSVSSWPSEILDRLSLFEQVAAHIEKRVLAGELAVGLRLPAEGELAAHYGVSRAVIREALARLREQGLIETRNGKGTFVRRPEGEYLSDTMLRQFRFAASYDLKWIDDLFEARFAVEVKTAELAARRATDVDLALICDSLKAQRQSLTDMPSWIPADFGFHLAVATSSHNPVLASLLTPMNKVIQETVAEGYRNPPAVTNGLAEHEEVWQKIKSRDAEGAADAMLRHLLQSEERSRSAYSSKSASVLGPRRESPA
jgi:GntR family transcriptional regulator, transcriptional repressor for pyruvate dehydrogenase complex